MHDAELALLPRDAEVFLLVGHPFGIDQTLIAPLVDEGPGLSHRPLVPSPRPGWTGEQLPGEFGLGHVLILLAEDGTKGVC